MADSIFVSSDTYNGSEEFENAPDLEIENGVLTKYIGNGGRAVIPEYVTSIGDSAFYKAKKLTSVQIPNSVTSIGEKAFYGCNNLASIHIPNSITSIGNNAFQECTRLASVIIPDSVTSIGHNAFANTGLKSIKIPNGIKDIPSGMCARCRNLTDISMDGVYSISNYAFSECKKLQKLTIPNSVICIGDGAFASCTALETVQIPLSVVTIEQKAFHDCKSLVKIFYRGKIKEWKKITKACKQDIKQYDIICSDGKISGQYIGKPWYY